MLFCALLPTLYSLTQAIAKPQPRDSIFNGTRWAIDSGLRLSSDEPLTSYGFMGFTGLDFYSDLRLFGAHRGNLVAQVYLFDFGSVGFSGDSQNMFTYAPCVVAPEIILAPRGLLNIKFGHIWPSYGLRNDVNTTQTLRQLINIQNVGLGMPVDWGAELNGQTTALSYHLSLTRGSGKWWSSEGNRYILSGRLGLTESSAFAKLTDAKLGLSGMSSRLAGASGLIERWRAGVDIQYSRLLSFLFEGSVGQDFDLDASGARGEGRAVINLIGELGWRSPSDQWFVYTQLRYLSGEILSDPNELGESDESNESGGSPLLLPQEQLDEDAMSSARFITTEVQDSLTLGVLYQPVNSLYLGSELVFRRGESAPLGRIQARYRW